MSGKILVTGSAGTVGSAIVQGLAAAGEKVVAGVHTPEKIASLPWPENVEPVHFDWEDSATWERVIPGVERVMVIAPPGSPADRLMIPAIDYFHREGVMRFVVLSAMGIEYAPEAPLRKVEVHLDRTGTTNTFLRPNWFMQNFTGLYHGMIAERSMIALPAGGATTSFVDVRDIADAAVMALRFPEVHGGREYALTGPEALTHREVASIISEVTGRTIEYSPVEDEGAIDLLVQQGLDRDSAAFIVSLYGSVRDGNAAAVTDHVEVTTGHPARSFRAFAEAAASLWG